MVPKIKLERDRIKSQLTSKRRKRIRLSNETEAVKRKRRRQQIREDCLKECMSRNNTNDVTYIVAIGSDDESDMDDTDDANLENLELLNVDL